MKNLRKTLLLPPLVLSALLVVVFAQQPKGPLGSAQHGLAIEIALSKAFYVPAGNAGHQLAAFVRVPSTGGEAAKAEQITAIKLAPEMLGDKVKVTVSAISGDTSVIKKCSDWNTLKESPIASYTLSEGEEVTVSQLNSLGANFRDGKLSFRAVALRAAPAAPQAGLLEGGGSCGCGWCGSLSCCPNDGACLGCGTCGQVCCTPPPNGN